MTEVMQPRTLRPYQVEAVDAVISAWGSDTRRVGVVLPTGAGKSTVIAALAAEAYRLGLRVVMLAHRGELLEQMRDAVHAVDPTLIGSVGIVRAAQDDHHQPIVAATLQTLANARRLDRLGPREVILWDEVHHIGAATYQDLMNDLGGYSGAFFCGFTATMRRSEGVALGVAIQEVVYERDLRWAIGEGFLVPPTGLTVRLPDLDDLSKVRTIAGDFANSEMAEVMEASADSVVDAIMRHAPDRSPIIFAASVMAGEIMAAALTEAGYPAEAVSGGHTLAERQPIYERYRMGVTRALVTVQVLTEGADFPMCDCVVIARPTQSQVLYSQMVGRALRLWPGKQDALVLDLAGTTRVLKLVTLTNLGLDVEQRTVDEFGDEIDPLDQDMDDFDDSVPQPKPKREGPLEFVSIDLFGERTDTVWLATIKGTPFIPLREKCVFLCRVPETDSYWIGWATTKGEFRGDWLAERQAFELDDARHRAEQLCMEQFFESPPTRDMSWRRNQPPSDAQLQFARRLGIPDTEDMTKARLSDEISIKLTSKVLDRWF